MGKALMTFTAVALCLFAAAPVLGGLAWIMLAMGRDDLADGCATLAALALAGAALFAIRAMEG